MDTYSLFSLIAVGALWGCTNSLIKKGSEDKQSEVDTPSNKSPKAWILYVVKSVVNLFRNWKFLLPFALNQSGSLLYYVLLGSSGKYPEIHFARHSLH
mmetsp:Transcript_4903/g.5747  ORF Transcript_4903/g.5747 Transcript_4903/m.5747 type:complete len:98 (+) Transcript_4903:179-472(+)